VEKGLRTKRNPPSFPTKGEGTVWRNFKFFG